MKKLSIVAMGLLAVAGLSADDAINTWASDLTLDSQIKFQSEYRYRGRQESNKTFAPSARLGYNVLDGARVYIGFDSALQLEDNSAGEEEEEVSPFGQHFSPRIGVSYDVTDMFSLDVGYIYHFWNNMKHADLKGYSHEVYAGISADVLASPAIYAYYDFTRQEIAVEGSVSYFLDLSDYVCEGLGLDLSARAGFDSAKKPYGQARDSWYIYNTAVPVQIQVGKKNYCYYGASADLVYSLNDNIKIKAGVEFAGNSAKKNSWANCLTGRFGNTAHKNGIWCNASIDCEF